MGRFTSAHRCIQKDRLQTGQAAFYLISKIVNKTHLTFYLSIVPHLTLRFYTKQKWQTDNWFYNPSKYLPAFVTIMNFLVLLFRLLGACHVHISRALGFTVVICMNALCTKTVWKYESVRFDTQVLVQVTSSRTLRWHSSNTC